MGTEKKFYGLIIPKKQEKVQAKKKSIFDSDSDDDSRVFVERKRTEPPKSSKTRIAEQKLLNDDPSIYEYDEIYDTMKEQNSQQKTGTKKKEPRFVQSLLKAADKRKKDQDRRLEKKIQTERVKEGDEFKDKEAFVTSAYRQKMEDMEKEEERERLQNQLDDMMDVTKQNDLSGFYRHYLNQAVGEEKVVKFEDTYSCDSPKNITIKTEPIEKSSSSSRKIDVREGKRSKKREKSHAKHRRHHSSSSSEHGSSDDHPLDQPLISSKYDIKKERKYSSDEPSHNSEHSQYSGLAEKESGSQKQRRDSFEQPDTTSHTKQSKNSDHESREYSSDEPSHSSKHSQHGEQAEKESGSRKRRHDSFEQSDTTSHTKQSKNSDHEAREINLDADDDDIVESDSEPAIGEKSDKNKKRTDISVKFIKRTVGEIFENAQARYFKRMDERGS